jgi:hypothetical protein
METHSEINIEMMANLEMAKGRINNTGTILRNRLKANAVH